MSYVPTWGPSGKIEEGGASKPLSQHLSETISSLASGAVPVAASGVQLGGGIGLAERLSELGDADAALDLRLYLVEAAQPSGTIGLLTLAPESGYIAAWVDPVTGRSPLRLTVAGKLEIDDVALSGKTYAELEADDLALFNSLFGTGGRLNGDSWALTSGSLA